MTKTARPQPEPVDLIVGARLAARRQELNLTQSELAAALGVTFQQVQKYERGANRVSSSKLWLAAEFLGVPVSAFFPSTNAALSDEVDQIASSPTVRRVVFEAKALKPKDQELVAAFIRRMVERDTSE